MKEYYNGEIGKLKKEIADLQAGMSKGTGIEPDKPPKDGKKKDDDRDTTTIDALY